MLNVLKAKGLEAGQNSPTSPKRRFICHSFSPPNQKDLQ